MKPACETVRELDRGVSRDIYVCELHVDHFAHSKETEKIKINSKSLSIIPSSMDTVRNFVYYILSND